MVREQNHCEPLQDRSVRDFIERYAYSGEGHFKMAASVSHPKTTIRIIRSPWLWRLIAVSMWALFIAKLLGYDCVNWVFEHISPQLVHFKGILLVTVGFGVWWLIGTLRIILVAVYPLVLLTYDLPCLVVNNWVSVLLKIAFRNWIAILLLAPVLIRMFRPLSSQVLFLLAAVVSGVLILGNAGDIPIIVSMFFLFIYLARHYYRELQTAFAPARFLSRIVDFMVTTWRGKRDGILMKGFADLKSDAPDYKDRSVNHLVWLLLCKGMGVHVVNGLRRFQESQLLIAYALLALAYTILVTVVVFAFEYLGLSLIDISSFKGVAGGNFFSFLYFSYTTFLTAADGTIVAASAWARLLTTAELTCFVLVCTYLLFILTTVVRERHREELDRLTTELTSETHAIEKLISDNYGMTVSEAIAHLVANFPAKVVIIGGFYEFPPISSSPSSRPVVPRSGP